MLFRFPPHHHVWKFFSVSLIPTLRNECAGPQNGRAMNCTASFKAWYAAPAGPFPLYCLCQPDCVMFWSWRYVVISGCPMPCVPPWRGSHRCRHQDFLCRRKSCVWSRDACPIATRCASLQLSKKKPLQSQRLNISSQRIIKFKKYISILHCI